MIIQIHCSMIFKGSWKFRPFFVGIHVFENKHKLKLLKKFLGWFYHIIFQIPLESRLATIAMAFFLPSFFQFLQCSFMFCNSFYKITFFSSLTLWSFWMLVSKESISFSASVYFSPSALLEISSKELTILIR